MSKALDFIHINTVVNPDDKPDLERLGTFILALSRTDLGERGARGVGRVQPRGRDYAAVFDNGVRLVRQSDSGFVLFRETACPVGECGEKTFSTGKHQEMCARHWNELHSQEVA